MFMILVLTIVVDDSLEIHKYLMKKNNMTQRYLDLLGKCLL